jgi:hypothetical protein
MLAVSGKLRAGRIPETNRGLASVHAADYNLFRSNEALKSGNQPHQLLLYSHSQDCAHIAWLQLAVAPAMCRGVGRGPTMAAT